MKNRKEKSWVKYLDKRKYCVGTEPSALVYICILVTSTTTGHGGSVVSALASQQKVVNQPPVVARVFFSPKHFLPYHSNILYIIPVRPSK